MSDVVGGLLSAALAVFVLYWSLRGFAVMLDVVLNWGSRD